MNDLKVQLIYLKDLPQYDTEKLYELWLPTEPGVLKTNREFAIYDDVPVKDVRNSNVEFDFHTTGFKFMDRPSKHLVSGTDLDVSTPDSECPPTLVPYLTESVEFMTEIFAAEKVFCYDWRVITRCLELISPTWTNLIDSVQEKQRARGVRARL